MPDQYLTYMTQEGDTWDAIALDFYGSEYKSSILIAANPDYAKTLIFESGVSLIIPSISEDIPDSLPPWKRGE